MSFTFHAAVRAQQRGIPPFIDQLLEDFGKEEFDGHGGIRLVFTKQSIHRMEAQLGRAIVRIIKRYLKAYKVVSASDGATITIGHRTSRIRRR